MEWLIGRRTLANVLCTDGVKPQLKETYFLGLCFAYVCVERGDACHGCYLSLRNSSRLFIFVRKASCSLLNLFPVTLAITSSATTAIPSVSRPKYIPSITRGTMFSTKSFSRNCLLLAVLAYSVAANPAPAPAVTEGPQAYVSYADLPAFSTLKPCAQGCLKYNGVYHCSCKSPFLSSPFCICTTLPEQEAYHYPLVLSFTKTYH